MTYTDTLYAFAAYAAAINLVGFMAMVWDKECARTGKWRLPERLLLALALLGGTIGVFAGHRIWRHKTESQPFRVYLRMIIIIQFAVLMSLALPEVRNAVWEFLQVAPS